MSAFLLAAFMVAGMGVTHAADPLVQLLEVLRKRGSITEDEYKELKKSATTPSTKIKSFEERLIQQDHKIDQLGSDLTSQMSKKISESYEDAIGKAVDGLADKSGTIAALLERVIEGKPEKETEKEA